MVTFLDSSKAFVNLFYWRFQIQKNIKRTFYFNFFFSAYIKKDLEC